MDNANFTVSPFGASDEKSYRGNNNAADNCTAVSTTAEGDGHGHSSRSYEAEAYQYPGHANASSLQDNFAGSGPVDISGHPKELCVNKLGHTMVTPPEGEQYSYVNYGGSTCYE